MESIKQIYRIGHGPSSSHTMGPMRAARMFLERNRGAVRFNVTLYGSLAATGKGHMTDAAILEVLSPVAKTNITWEPKVFLPFHPNGILFQSFDESGEELDNWTIYSIGGGTLANETYNELTQGQVYEMHTIKDIQAWCEKTGHSYWEYVEQCEGPQIWDYLAEVWEVMQQAVRNGLEAEGILPGGLGIRRYDPCQRLRQQYQKPWDGLCVCSGRFRGERLRRQDRDGPDLRFVRCHAGCALPSERVPRLP